jgi:hypothetical protein
MLHTLVTQIALLRLLYVTSITTKPPGFQIHPAVK